MSWSEIEIHRARLSSLFTGEGIDCTDLPLDVLVNGQVFPVLLPWSMLPGNARMPFETDLKWYLGKYSSREPFSTSRAQDVASRLRSYGERLVMTTVPPQVQHHFKDEPVLIRIDDNDSSAMRINLIHWEILEQLELWPESARPRNVSVVRICSQGLKDLDPAESDTDWDELSPISNVLALTARPKGCEDVPHRIVTRSIDGVITSLRPAGKLNLSFHIVRPGTFKALESALKSGGYGHYHIVHLDVHGFCEDDDNCSLVFMAPDASLVDNAPHLVSAYDVAQLLTRYGCRQVILNACRSAREVGALSSLARIMVQQGLYRVVGMAYNLSESAATTFVSTFYFRLFQPESGLLDSVRFARNALRTNTDRRSAYGPVPMNADHILPIVYSRKMNGLQAMLKEESGGFATPCSMGVLEDIHWNNMMAWKATAHDSVRRFVATKPAFEAFSNDGLPDPAHLEEQIQEIIDAVGDAMIAHQTLYRSSKLPHGLLSDVLQMKPRLLSPDRANQAAQLSGRTSPDAVCEGKVTDGGRAEGASPHQSQAKDCYVSEDIGRDDRNLADTVLDLPSPCRQTFEFSSTFMDSGLSPLVCDLCEGACWSTYHCEICNGGDLDVCDHCMGPGKHCPNLCHTLLRRTYQNGDLLRLIGDIVPPKKADMNGVDWFFPGREEDLFDLENHLVSKSHFRDVVGFPGVGKTAFVQHARDWWKTTGLIECAVTVDLSDTRFSDWRKIELDIQHQLGESSDTKSQEDCGLLESIKARQCLLIFENLHPTLKPMSDWSPKARRQFRDFLGTICFTSSLAVVISRDEVSWLANIGRFRESNVMFLQGLNMRSSVQIALNYLARYRKTIDTNDLETFSFFEECIALMDGNPEAIEMLMYDMAQRDLDVRSYYEHITAGGEVYLSPDLFERCTSATQSARDVYHYVAEVIKSRPRELFDPHDPRYLAPFWKVVPQNLSDYWQFLYRALHQGLDNQGTPDPFSTAHQTKSHIEILRSDTLRQLFEPDDEPSISSQNHRVSAEVFKTFRLMGLIYEDRIQSSLPELGISSDARYFCIHPILTLTLRASYRDRCPNRWAEHAVKTAFFRFMMRWRNPTANPRASQTDMPIALDWQQRELDFTNLVAATSFGLSMEPEPLTLMLLLLRGLSQFIQPLNEVCRQAISLNIKVRAVRALAEHLRSQSVSVWASQTTEDTWMADIDQVVLKGAAADVTTDPIGWLEGTLTSHVVIYCFRALYDALKLRIRCPQDVLDALSFVVTAHAEAVMSCPSSYVDLEDSVVDMANMTKSLWPIMLGTLQPGSKQAPWDPFTEFGSRGSKRASDINALYGLSSLEKTSVTSGATVVLPPRMDAANRAEVILTQQLLDDAEGVDATDKKVKILLHLINLAAQSGDYVSGSKRLEELMMLENSHPDIHAKWRKLMIRGRESLVQADLVSRGKFAEVTRRLNREHQATRALNLEIIWDVQQRWHDRLNVELYIDSRLPEQWFLDVSR